jgi:5-methylcytosine-specific restriction protein A
MTKRPKKPCGFRGCPKVTISKSGYCPEHRKAVVKDYEKTRETATQRGYTKRAWQNLRKMILNAHPLCRDPHRTHRRYGEAVAATEVHHIDGNRNNNIVENLEPLCKQCHSRLTAQEHGFGMGRVYTAPYSR